jgi:hypothetical protein
MSDSFKAMPPWSASSRDMELKKLTTLLVVEAIEPCLGTWNRLGYHVTVRVPEEGPLGFAILRSVSSGELMLQTTASLAEDLPAVAKKKPSHVLYAEVASLDTAEKALGGARVLVPRRKTFYGANELWLELEDGRILGLAEHSG